MAAPQQTLSQQAIAVFDSSPALASTAGLGAFVALASNGKVVTYEWVDVDDDDIVIPGFGRWDD